MINFIYMFYIIGGGMNTFRSLGKWWVPLAGLFLILFGVGLLFEVTVPAILLGILAVLSGVLALFSS